MLNESGENVDMLDESPSRESLDGLEGSDDQRVAEPEVQVEQTPKEPAPVAPQFSHPHLQGKTPAEIEALFNLMQNTVQGQTRRINELASAPPPQIQSAQPQDEPKGDFFDNPLGHIRRELSAAVAPINQEIANIKAQTAVNYAWEQVGMKFADFDTVRPHIEIMMSNMDVSPQQVTAELLESLYYGAKGYIATHQGSPGAPQAPPTGSQRPAPPQHRPSSAPLPKANGSKLRELTEDERRMAREFNLTHEEFLRWGEKDEGDVANAEVK